MKKSEGRENWYIEKKIKFYNDTDSYIISLLPTILFQPWRHRYPYCAVVDITWLTFHISIGVWKRKEVK